MIKPLTSLRFFFALMVFLSHLIFVQNVRLVYIYNRFFHEGRLGVAFFFILSGFVLSLNYKKSLLAGTIQKKEFWLARFARIYPLHVLTLIIAIPVVHDLQGNLITAIGKLCSNLFLVQSFIPSENWYFTFNDPSWSISDESFFYLLFPFVIIFFYSYPRLIKYSLLFLLLIPIGIYFCPQQFHQRYFYVSPIARFIDFYIGMLLYNIFESDWLGKFFQSFRSATCIELGSLLLFIAFFYYYPLIPDAYRFSCYYWLPMALLIFSFAYQKGGLSIILSNKRLVYLGEISFGFYMIHQICIRYITGLNNKFNLIHNDYFIIGIIFSLTLIASHLSFTLIELPCKRFIKAKYAQNARPV
jgi:peptidoglycan/LPS O-acetylase OafA/YrhL